MKSILISCIVMYFSDCIKMQKVQNRNEENKNMVKKREIIVKQKTENIYTYVYSRYVDIV